MAGADDLKQIVAAIRKGVGPNAARVMSAGVRSDVRSVITTGLEVLDHFVLGCGGIPVGRMGELFAENSAGKSSLVLHLLAQAQAQPKTLAVLADTEGTLTTERAEVFGVDPDAVLLLETETLEDTLAAIEHAIKNIPVGWQALIVHDSIAATPTKAEIDKGLIGQSKMAERARVLSQACRGLVHLLLQHNAALIFVNQTRQNIGVAFGDNTVTPGGEAVKFHASWRLRIWSGKGDADQLGGHKAKRVTIKAVKNKLSIPNRKASFKLNFTEGWDNDYSTLQLARDLGVVKERSRKVETARDALIAERVFPELRDMTSDEASGEPSSENVADEDDVIDME